MQIIIPDKVKTIIGQLQDEGYEAYVVGGCVRDSILGRTPHDWDITTNAKPMEVKKLFRRTIDIGIEHGTVKVMIGDEGYEITTYRIDGDYEDSRHPSSVKFTSELSEDLYRRDFTINAMAYNDKDGLVDLFGGLEDIKTGTIRAVGNPIERFSEDALRMMRAVRFSAQLNYSIEEETKAAITKLAPTLANISAERVREELEKLIVSNNPDRMRDMYKLGISKIVLPEWDVMMECEQNTPHHYMSVGEHTIYALNECRKYDLEMTEHEKKVYRLTILLHDVSKPEMKRVDEYNVDHFTGHPEKGAGVAADILRRLKYDNATIKDVEKLIYYHDYRPALTLPKVRRLMINVGPSRMPLLMAVKWADLNAHSDYEFKDKTDQILGLDRLYKEIISAGDCLSIKELALNGGDLKAFGIKEGPEIGRILNILFEEVVNVPQHNTREYLMKMVNSIMQE